MLAIYALFKHNNFAATPSDKEKNVDYNLYQLLVHLEDGNVNILHNLFFLNIVKLASHHYKCPANENEVHIIVILRLRSQVIKNVFIWKVQSGVVRRAESMKELLQAELKKLTHYTLNVSIACDEKQEKYLVVGITYFGNQFFLNQCGNNHKIIIFLDESVEEVASANLSLCKLQILYDTVDIEEVEQSVKKTLAKWELAQPTAIVVGMEEDMYDTVGFWRTLKVPTFVCFREAMLEIEKSMTSFVYNLNVIANVKNLQDYFEYAALLTLVYL